MKKKILPVIVLLLVLGFAYFNLSFEPTNIEVNLTDNNELIVNYQSINPFLKTFCLSSKEEPKKDANWILAEKNSCTLAYEESDIYIKHGNKIFKVKDYKPVGKLKNLKLDRTKIYLAVNDQAKLNPIYDVLGTLDIDFLYESLDDKIASVSEEGIITALKT